LIINVVNLYLVVHQIQVLNQKQAKQQFAKILLNVHMFKKKKSFSINDL
jgi:hypothetical protein